MLLRPFNSLIALLTAVILFLGFSILWNANDSPPALVPFAPSTPASRISESVAGEKEKVDIQATLAVGQSALVDGSAPASEPTETVSKIEGSQEPQKPSEGSTKGETSESKPKDPPKPDESGFLPAIKKGQLPNPMRIFLLEDAGSHEEVFGALIYAFAQIPNSYIYQYLFRPRFNIFAVLKSFNLKNLAKPRFSTSMKLNEQTPQPDIILATTCEFDVTRLQTQMTYMLGNGSYLFCTIHHADRWHNESSYKYYNAIKPWVEADRVTFLFLSGHTKRYVEEIVLPSWEPKHRIAATKFEVFVPVFPVEPSTKKEMSFSLQGNYESVRRDYKSIFGRFSNFAKKNPDKPQFQQLRMHLIGHGNHPEVPEDIRERVEFNEGLEFLEFYKILSESFALLPAFANDEYYDRKASSSVPASLIAGVPIVGKRRLLQTYDYMTEDSMWIQDDEEDDMDVIGRILEMSEQQIEDQKARTRERNREILDENANKALMWSRTITYQQKRTGQEPLREGWNWEW
ncbi:hypothetical protein POJ06DRAFT_280710 [Lipomyces tetrasporus]|uniref:Uncharacterized protein n=1 Tax=Lipomyces tetrasporus TaxID=54092 RepID=A0AAD7QV96_9ASCO|nr:uncharacterized protein POJ06DRAFT_280710 [Lipomyces tetrasporus]KAJ8102155.1 hypothetical protein POJ06DRAFT_280710 [Lipomyces tetrasporus]